MKNNIQYLKGDSGQVVMFVIFVVLFLVLFVSLFISNTLTKQSKIAIAAANSVQAYYIADSGAENVLYKISQMAEGDTLSKGAFDIDPLFTAYGGTSSAEVTELASDSATAKDRIDIIGTYQRTSRAIQLFW
jgi:hypothetical protein